MSIASEPSVVEESRCQLKCISFYSFYIHEYLFGIATIKGMERHLAQMLSCLPAKIPTTRLGTISAEQRLHTHRHGVVEGVVVDEAQ